jgi:hypothetical protein
MAFPDDISKRFFAQKIEAAGSGDFRTEPGQPIEASNQIRGIDDCFLDILENESREQIESAV